MAYETENRIEIGNRIKELRKKRGLTLSELKEETGISIGFLSDVERGGSAISSEKLVAIAKALEVSADYLLSGDRPGSSQDQEINIPDALNRLALTRDLTYAKTLTLLEARRSLIARRSRGDIPDWTEENWESFYQTVKEYI